MIKVLDNQWVRWS